MVSEFGTMTTRESPEVSWNRNACPQKKTHNSRSVYFNVLTNTQAHARTHKRCINTLGIIIMIRTEEQSTLGVIIQKNASLSAS